MILYYATAETGDRPLLIKEWTVGGVSIPIDGTVKEGVRPEGPETFSFTWPETRFEELINDLQIKESGLRVLEYILTRSLT